MTADGARLDERLLDHVEPADARVLEPRKVSVENWVLEASFYLNFPSFSSPFSSLFSLFFPFPVLPVTSPYSRK